MSLTLVLPFAFLLHLLPDAKDRDMVFLAKPKWFCWSMTRFGLPLLIGVMFSATFCGCNYFILAGYLIGGPPSNEPDFDAMTAKSMTNYGVTVAVVCDAPVELKWEHNKIDQELAKYVTRKMALKKIRVIGSDRVYAWLDQHDKWDRPQEIGAALNVTYVVYIDLRDFGLYEPHSSNLYRGHAEAMVSVFEMDEEGDGERIYTKEVLSKYPLRVPKSTSEVSRPTFQRLYMTRLSEDIGRLFYEWYNGDDIPDAG